MPALTACDPSPSPARRCCSVTPRRWLAFCNKPLRELITEKLGNERWINDTERLKVRRRRRPLAAWQGMPASLQPPCRGQMWCAGTLCVVLKALSLRQSIALDTTLLPAPLVYRRSCARTPTTRRSSSAGRR